MTDVANESASGQFNKDMQVKVVHLGISTMPVYITCLAKQVMHSWQKNNNNDLTCNWLPPTFNSQVLVFMLHTGFAK